MNKLLSLLGLLLFSVSAFCQINVTVSGTITDTNGDGVENVIVHISTDSINTNFQYFSTAVTGADGTYSDTFEVPDGLTQGGVFAWIEDCNNSYQSQTGYWSPAGGPVFDFVYCNNNCSVGITESNASLLATATGAAPFTYLWNNNSTAASINVSISGTYCVEITDAAGCTSNACYYYDNNVIDTTCYVMIYLDSINTNGLGLTAVPGGVAPFAYEWSTGANTQVIDVSEPGTYCVNVYDANNCVATACYEYGIPTCGESVFIYQNDTYLSAAANIAGAIDYVWSTGETTQGITATDEGNYCVTITYGEGCNAIDCLYFYPDTNTVDSCYAEIVPVQNGSWLSVTAYGTPPFSYAWNTGESTPSIQMVGDTLYCVVVTDAVGCSSTACYDNFTTTCVESVFIYQNDTYLSAEANIAGVIDYVWSTGETTQGITATDEGNYCVTITYGEGCNAIDCLYFYPDTNTVDSCYAEIFPVQNGSWLSATGYGTAPFSYVWSTGAITSSIQVTEDTLYCVVVTDAVGCVSTTCYNQVTQPLFINGSLGSSIQEDSLFLNGVVNLFSINGNDVTNVATASTNGDFTFYDIEPGDYIVQALVDGYLPTYHFSELWWDEADIVNPEQPNTYAYILMIPLEELVAGPGSITGNVSEPDGFGGHQSGSRDLIPVQGAEMVLFNSDNEPVAYMFTDAEGNYSFADLPYGTYTVFIEIIGYEQVSYTITIGPNNEHAENVDFNVEESAITTATRAPLLENNFLSIYPNPVKGTLNMNLDLELKGEATVQLINLTGQVIYNDSFVAYQQQKNINVSSLNAGLYLVKVTTEEGIIVQQFIKE